MKLVLFAAAALAVGSAGMAQQTVEPANTNVERDARGIPVISAPATAPSGANQVVQIPAGAQVVPASNQGAVFSTQASAKTYPACTREVTDGCVQTYEGRRRR